MRRFFALVLVVLMPLQFSWAAAASYCEHEEQSGAGHFGHHEHPHCADANSDAEFEADADASGGNAPGAMDLECGQCHGQCSAMLTLPENLAGSPLKELPTAPADEAGGACAPTRPERPQWLPLA